MEKEAFYTEISSKKRWFELNLKEVWQYRDLIFLFTRKAFLLNYKQTILGPLWLFLKPFITSVVFTIVFGQVIGVSTDGIPRLLFYFNSNALWTFFSSCLVSNSSTFTSNAYVFGKVYFPRLTVPISNVLTNVIMFFIQFSMMVVFLIYYLWKGMVHPSVSAVVIVPFVLVLLGEMGMSFGIIVSSLTTKYRDLSVLVGFGVQLWMYASPVLYPLYNAESGFTRTVLLINPVTMPIELFRWSLLGRGEIVVWSLLWSCLLTILCVLLGIMIFNRVEKNFMDTV